MVLLKKETWLKADLESESQSTARSRPAVKYSARSFFDSKGNTMLKYSLQAAGHCAVSTCVAWKN